MYLFKYYRPDFFFEKAIRYNELYFSAPAQLNDPNDLNIDYRFDNKLKLWDTLLRSPCDKSYKNLSHILDLSNLKIHKGLNRIFRGKKIKSSIESLDSLFDSHVDEIRKIIDDGLLPINVIDSAIYGNIPEPRQYLVSLCENSIKERLYRKIVPAVFSVSFSANALDRMMWAHYAAGFSGCVVIYETQDFNIDGIPYPGMKLRENLFSSDKFNFPVKPIKYSNQAKEVSLLDPSANVAELFLTKNRFWRYEAEYRMFIPEANAGIGSERHVQRRANRNIGHIFHHDANVVKGIIFGPRMCEMKKESIWNCIKSNMENSNSTICYFFDSELSASGKITISKGQRAEKMKNFPLFRNKLSQTEMAKVLKEIGITN